MTTVPHVLPSPNMTAPIFFRGSRKLVVPHKVEESYDHGHAKFTRKMLHNLDQLKKFQERAKESPLTIEARQMEPISEELKKINHREFVDRKRCQQLRNECEELRILAQQLHVAKISKDTADRLKESNQRRLLSAQAAAEENERAEVERLKALETEREKELMLKEQRLAVRASLDAQMVQSRLRRQKKVEETVVEKEIRLAVQQQIDEEDKMNHEELQQLKIKKRNEMQELIQEKHAYQELQKELEKEATLKALQSSHLEEERKQLRDAEKLKALRQQQALSTLIGKQIFDIEDKKRQRDALLLDLLQEEYKAKNDARFRQQLEQEQEKRKRVREELEHYRAELMMRNGEKARQKREELIARRLNTQETDDVLRKEQELLNHQERKQYGAILKAMIADNQRKRAEATAENLQFLEMKAQAETERQQLITEERRKMLSEVPSGVLGYLPSHAVKDEERELFALPKHQQRLGGGDA